MRIRETLTTLVLFAPLAALAAPGAWSGKGEVGFLASQGNTDAKSANAAIDMALEQDRWKHAFHLGGLYSESADIVAAERWDTRWQSDYAVTTDLYAFGALRYGRDLFSGFQYQASGTAGLGYKIFDTNDVKLSAQLGAGYRKSRPQTLIKDASGAVISRIPGDTADEGVVSGGLDYSQVLTPTTLLTDKLLVESGSDNTLLTNSLALVVKMSDRLALSLGYNVQNNSKPPAGLKKLDTSETVNLVFAF
jgi:putative salt-induced outer membrane protein